ncbi:MAG: hypothetical protein K8F29_12780 [Kofleriaceae bacterium]|nr:hypothetical protein [Candidatus Methylomirabilis lanthanidiphila]
MRMRKSTLFLCAASAEIVALGLLLIHASLSEQARRASLQQNAAIVKRLGLTDLALFPEARYTRHLSQADWHSAFQDHPLSLEHFPSGSFTLPPKDVWSNDARLD